MLVKTEGVERLTRDHKPNDPEEKKRVEGVGGQGVVRLQKSFSKLFCSNMYDLHNPSFGKKCSWPKT